jgi:cyclase
MKTVYLPFLLVLLLLSPHEKNDLKGLATNFNVIALGPGLYTCLNTFGGKAICNAGIIDNGESTIVFDTFLSPDASEELIRVVKQLKLSPIRYVINSHAHNDHVRGNQSFPADVKILSTKATAEIIAREEPKAIAAEKEYGTIQYHHFDSLCSSYNGDTTARAYQMIKMMRAYSEELSIAYKKIKTRIPDTYVMNEASLDGSKRRVLLLDQGKGHTQSDMILYLPNDSTLCVGALVFNGCHPYLGDGSPDGWERILSELELIPVRTVVPGDGDVGNKPSIAAMRVYIESLQAMVLKMIEEGTGKAELPNVQIPERFQSWWLEDFFQDSMEFLYDAMK